MKKIIILILIVLFNINLNSALLDNINSYSAMEQAGGDTSLLTLDNNSSIMFNPATDVVNKKNFIKGFISSSFFNLPVYMLSFQIVKSNLNFGMALSYHKSENFPYIDIYGNSISTVAYNESYLLFHISKLIKNIIGIGINPKILIQNIDTDTEYYINFDIGLVTKKITIFSRDFSTGLTLKNLINNYTLSYNISANIIQYKTIGLNSALNLLTQKFKNLSVNIGVYINFYQKYLFILGYKINSYINNNFSTGLGIDIEKFSFYYSFSPSSLYNAHSVTINYRF